MFPIPNVEGLIEKVSAARYVSTLDLVRGFWQVPLTENASKLATFMTPTGTYRPLVLTFGLKNAPFAFSRLMHEVLKGAESFAVPYLDDIAVFRAPGNSIWNICSRYSFEYTRQA
uniref:Putative tick transposon n=1 Tax=Rhipicephalus microplus TaxID=6941 RepID=A0A6G5AC35_RHIMP